MSVLRLYLDEDAAQRDLLAALRARSVDVTFALETGMTAASDRRQLEWCQAEGRVLYTFNVSDFYALHREYRSTGRPHRGIVLAPQQRYSVGEQMRRVLRLRAARSAEEMQDQVEFLSAWG